MGGFLQSVELGGGRGGGGDVGFFHSICALRGIVHTTIMVSGCVKNIKRLVLWETSWRIPALFVGGIFRCQTRSVWVGSASLEKSTGPKVLEIWVHVVSGQIDSLENSVGSKVLEICVCFFRWGRILDFVLRWDRPSQHHVEARAFIFSTRRHNSSSLFFFCAEA